MSDTDPRDIEERLRHAADGLPALGPAFHEAIAALREAASTIHDIRAERAEWVIAHDEQVDRADRAEAENALLAAALTQAKEELEPVRSGGSALAAINIIDAALLLSKHSEPRVEPSEVWTPATERTCQRCRTTYIGRGTNDLGCPKCHGEPPTQEPK